MPDGTHLLADSYSCPSIKTGFIGEGQEVSAQSTQSMKIEKNNLLSQQSSQNNSKFLKRLLLTYIHHAIVKLNRYPIDICTISHIKCDIYQVGVAS